MDLRLRAAPARGARPPRRADERQAAGGGDAADRARGSVAETPATWRDLPLFPGATDDEPLIRVAPAPRPPLAVRKTPELPRAARPPRVVRRHEGPRLDLPQERAAAGGDARPAAVLLGLAEDAAAPPVHSRPAAAGAPSARATASSPRARGLAAAVDLATLLALDLVILYFTVRMAGLTIGQWAALPPLPLILFLVAVKVSYFSVFTTIGGQTIGKMAFQIRVVSEDDGLIHPGRAVARTLATAVSVLPLGAGLLPAFFQDGRALHDRLAHTRVVDVRPGA